MKYNKQYDLLNISNINLNFYSYENFLLRNSVEKSLILFWKEKKKEKES